MTASKDNDLLESLERSAGLRLLVDHGVVERRARRNHEVGNAKLAEELGRVGAAESGEFGNSVGRKRLRGRG